ncbi:TetR/AcrR family transcriptional regulator [Kitasatospora sp. NPDC127067]|uniref:TetR/AcrR family transcriptional regulator n=1 Tax=Kitasatospora sp. NPDC127067 TaxID=3347126 RepID=UPI00364A46A2
MANRSTSLQVRERLLTTADELFYADGIRAVGIDRVIAESQVSKSTMYVHFRTKEDLVQAYLRRRSDAWRDHVEPEIERRAQGPADRVLALFDVFHEVLAAPGYRGCPFANAAAEYPHHDGIQEQIAHHRAWLPGLFRRLLAAWEPDDMLIAQLVQLSDGAIAAAHLDHAEASALTARRTAELLLSTAEPSRRPVAQASAK